MGKRSFVRESRTHCGTDYQDVAVYPMTDREKRKTRNRKEVLSSPAQKNLNDRNAKRYFRQLVKTNFGAGDIAIHPTFAQEPESYEEAEAWLHKYIRRLKYARKKAGLDPLKYVAVIERGVRSNRLHIHMLINGGLPEEQVKALWYRERGTKNKPALPLGLIRTDALHPELFEDGLNRLAAYIAGDTGDKRRREDSRPKNKRRWIQSNNLDKPWRGRPNDSKYTARRLEKLARLPEDCEEVQTFWAKKYPEWSIYSIEKSLNPETGRTSWYLEMKRRENQQCKKRTRPPNSRRSSSGRRTTGNGGQP